MNGVVLLVGGLLLVAVIKRKPWIPIYTNVRKSADENESRAHFCVHEFKEACKM